MYMNSKSCSPDFHEWFANQLLPCLPIAEFYSCVGGVLSLFALFWLQRLDAHRVMPPNQPTAGALSVPSFSFSQSKSTSTSASFLSASFTGGSVPKGVKPIEGVLDTGCGRGGAWVLAMPRVHGLLLMASLMRLDRGRVGASPAADGLSVSCGRL